MGMPHQCRSAFISGPLIDRFGAKELTLLFSRETAGLWVTANVAILKKDSGQDR
jgi:hypothetical protein